MEETVTISVGTTWERTSELRIVRNLSHVGRPERLQQKWHCHENGEIEWVDIPIVNE
jgi:hypothetical protein